MISDKATFIEWQNKGQRIAMARVVETWRSSPRPAGSTLLVNELGEMIGSVSGGCVEKAVVAKSLKVLEANKPELVKYGVADDEAWEVGLSCGGALTVYVEPFFNEQDWDIINTCQKQNKGLIILTELNASGLHYFIDPEMENAHSQEVNEAMRSYFLKDQNGIIEKEGVTYFCHVFPPKKRMILIGSAHITAEMISLAHQYDFETIVIDPRDTFAKKTAYADQPSQMLVNWPQEVLHDIQLDHNSYVVILSHDPKIDDEALKILLKSQARYIGALGSKRTHAKRVERLKGYGFTEEEIAKIHAPIGLPINALLPKEIALSVMSEIIKVKNG